MEQKERYGKSAVAFVAVPIRDLEKCRQLAEYLHMTMPETLHYAIRKGIECAFATSERPEVHDD